MSLPMIAWWVFLFASGYGCAVVVDYFSYGAKLERYLKRMDEMHKEEEYQGIGRPAPWPAPTDRPKPLDDIANAGVHWQGHGPEGHD